MLKKEITLGNLIAIMLTFGMAVFTWGVSISTRLEGSEVRVENMDSKTDDNKRKIEKVDDKVDDNFKTIILKLERIIENQNNDK